MAGRSLPEVCLERFSREVSLEPVSGFEDLERIKLLNGDPGGSIRIYKGEKIKRVNAVDFELGQGVPAPHHHNRRVLGAEIFQVAPDFSYRLPIWGINTLKFEDGSYYFDTDFSFGFDLVMDYEFTMKYMDPFDELYKKYSTHPDLEMVPLSRMTTWVRTFISPVFMAATTSMEKSGVVHALCGDLIALWMRIYRDTGEKDEALQVSQQQRIKSQYAGMRDSDRMGKILMKTYGQETFAKFFKAMADQ